MIVARLGLAATPTDSAEIERLVSRLIAGERKGSG